MLSYIGADQGHEGSSARLIVYTAHFIRAGLAFQDRVPILSVLGLPLDMVRARVKFWSGTDGAKSFTRLNLSVPNQFFWYAYFFHPSRAKNFLPCKWGFSLQFIFFFRTAVLRQLFDIRFSYKHCNFSRVCLLVKTASKTVTISIRRKISHR